jgi:hypothetical protein
MMTRYLWIIYIRIQVEFRQKQKFKNVYIFRLTMYKIVKIGI